MAIVSFNIPDSLIAELNLIALTEGFPTAKALVAHFLRQKIKAYRVNKAKADAGAVAEAQADQEVAGIT